MKNSLNYKIVLAIVIIVCIMDVSFIFVNYVNYMNVNRDYTDSLAQTVANTCRLVVDGNSVTVPVIQAIAEKIKEVLDKNGRN